MIGFCTGHGIFGMDQGVSIVLVLGIYGRGGQIHRICLPLHKCDGNNFSHVAAAPALSTYGFWMRTEVSRWGKVIVFCIWRNMYRGLGPISRTDLS